MHLWQKYFKYAPSFFFHGNHLFFYRCPSQSSFCLTGLFFYLSSILAFLLAEISYKSSSVLQYQFSFCRKSFLSFWEISCINRAQVFCQVILRTHINGSSHSFKKKISLCQSPPSPLQWWVDSGTNTLAFTEIEFNWQEKWQDVNKMSTPPPCLDRPMVSNSIFPNATQNHVSSDAKIFKPVSTQEFLSTYDICWPKLSYLPKRCH